LDWDWLVVFNGWSWYLSIFCKVEFILRVARLNVNYFDLFVVAEEKQQIGLAEEVKHDHVFNQE